MASGLKSQAQIQQAERALVGPYIVGGVLQAVAYGILIAQYWYIVMKAKHRPSRRSHIYLGALAIFNTAQCAATIAVRLIAFRYVWKTLNDPIQ